MTDDSTVKSFNLVDRPWIPVAGEKTLRSLMDIFTSPAPLRLSGNAVDKIVIFRFLLSIVHASSEIPDEAAWHALTPEKIAENARAYLEKHKNCFDLYDTEHPFLQFPKLKEYVSDNQEGNKESEKRSLWALRVNYSDNQSILTSWQVRIPLEDDDAARFLLRACCASLASAVFEKDILLSKDSGIKKRKYAAPGTLLGSSLKGYLHSYLLGDDLWESLHDNLLTVEEIAKLNAYPKGVGRPFWEVLPMEEDDNQAKLYKDSYQGRIFPVDKCILLTDRGEQVIKTDGIPYRSGIDVIDPALTVFDGKNGRDALSATVQKRPWRELASLLNFLNSKEKSSPFFLSFGLKHLRGTKQKIIRFWVGGVEISYSNGGQQVRKSNDYVESEFSLPAYILTEQEQWLKHYEELMIELDSCSKSLYSAVAQYHKLMNNDSGGKLAGRAATRFWERMESRAQSIIDLAADPQTEMVEEETRLWLNAVMDIYNESCPNDTARQMTAWVEANPKFNRKKGKNTNGK